jgi:ribosomal protein S18 acetylase RimI-like enzyme
MNADIHLEEATSATEELVATLARLVPQLTSKSRPPDRGQLESLLHSGSSTLLVARASDANGPIIGVACLGVYRVLTGMRAVIEDVVVDESARGKGVGEALVQRLLELARAKGVRGVSLTSNTNRRAANRLYVRIGFMPGATNLYYYKFD